MSLTKEIQKRRTFAIIAHPDAGKTTLTEKLLLFGRDLGNHFSVAHTQKVRAMRVSTAYDNGISGSPGASWIPVYVRVCGRLGECMYNFLA